MSSITSMPRDVSRAIVNFIENDEDVLALHATCRLFRAECDTIIVKEIIPDILPFLREQFVRMQRELRASTPTHPSFAWQSKRKSERISLDDDSDTSQGIQEELMDLKERIEGLKAILRRNPPPSLEEI